MKKIITLIFALVCLLSCNESFDKNSKKFQPIKIDKNGYKILKTEKFITKHDTFTIGAILIKRKDTGTVVPLFRYTLSLCIKENLIAADFFQPSEYGRKKESQKFEWPETITKNKRHIATVDARGLGGNWKEKISKENYYSPFEF